MQTCADRIEPGRYSEIWLYSVLSGYHEFDDDDCNIISQYTVYSTTVILYIQYVQYILYIAVYSILYIQQNGSFSFLVFYIVYCIAVLCYARIIV